MSQARVRFLHRRNYRYRRIADAARLLPLAGALLLLLPLLRLVNEPSAEGARTSQVGLYIFAVWVLLIGAALGFSRGLRDQRTTEDELHPTRGAEESDA